MKFRIIVAALLIAGSAQAQNTNEPPLTPQENYQFGQILIECSAYFRIGAEVARNLDMTSSATAWEDGERGWRIAGEFLLVGGLASDRQTDVKEIAGYISDAKRNDLLAMQEEQHWQKGDVVASFTRECEPFRKAQEDIVRALRGAK